MSVPNDLISLNLERSAIGGLINFPEIIMEIDSMFGERDFSHNTHKALYSVLKNTVVNGEKVEKVILAQKLTDLKLRFEDIDIFTYIENASFTKIRPDGIKDITKELIKLRVRRELYENAELVQNYIREAGNKEIDEIVSNVDSIHGEQISQYTSDNEPIDLYAGIENLINTIAKNPVIEVGLKTPFPQWNKWFGGLISQNGVYNIISRSGEGKSAFLSNMAKGISTLNECPVLILDTEMSWDLNMFRAAAAECQINSWYLRTGQWTKNEELIRKVKIGIEKIKQYKGKIHHLYVPNKDIKEIISMARRWFYKNVGRGNKGMIVYDYLKITSDVEKNRQEWQQLGDKISYLNELGYDLNIPIFTAGQQNRGAEFNGVRNDDSTTAGASDRINQYACFNAVFRAKTLEEMSEQGMQYGTHLLKPFKTSRTNGVDDFNKYKNVRILDHAGKGKYKANFINYEIADYLITEKGTYQDIVNAQNLQHHLLQPDKSGKKTYPVKITQ